MAWKESDLLNDLETRFKSVGVPEYANPQEPVDSKGISWMVVNVLESKTVDGVPVASRRNISYYVKNRGLDTEEAWYSEGTPLPTKSIDELDGSALTAYLFKSQELRDRILGQMFAITHEVYREDESIPEHEKRVDLCAKVVLDPDKYVNIFSMICSLWPAIREKKLNCTDEDIEAAIKYWWTDVALRS